MEDWGLKTWVSTLNETGYSLIVWTTFVSKLHTYTPNQKRGREDSRGPISKETHRRRGNRNRFFLVCTSFGLGLVVDPGFWFFLVVKFGWTGPFRLNVVNLMSGTNTLIYKDQCTVTGTLTKEFIVMSLSIGYVTTLKKYMELLQETLKNYITRISDTN